MGRPMVLGTLVRFRLACAAAQNLPGTVLRQRPSAEGCSIDGASHLDSSPFRFREGVTKASRSAETE